MTARLRSIAGAVVVAAPLFVAVLATGGGGCGRTELDPAEPCDGEVDTTRACSGFCGGGTQHCIDGFWRECEVPVTTRPCSNDCGPGTESCFDKQWHTCTVEPVERTCSSPCGDGHETCRENTWGACDAPQPKPPKLTTTVRDFHAHQPSDFELPLMGDYSETGLVEDELGPDDKPVYAGLSTTKTTSGAANFNLWYHDVPGVNLSTSIALPLTAAAGSQSDFYVYDNLSFFPIDNQLFGNEGLPHNYHFTLEAHTHFRYLGGEVFTFSGDDDTWVFINRRLVIDLGGIHTTETATVRLDTAASALSMIKGERYQLDIFFAERHTVRSTFTIRTSIADASSCE